MAGSATSMTSPRVAEGTIDRKLVVLLAVACGTAVANLYYAQPLLHAIATSFRIGPGSAGLIVTFSQIGYAAGLAFVVPLGDILNRRRFIPAALAVDALSLLACAAAPNIGVLVGLALVVGTGTVIAQMLVPLAAELADPSARGKVVGQVMSGLLIGILLARTLSGLVAQVSSWRVVYVCAAGIMVALAVVLSRALPRESARPSVGYGSLLRSAFDLLRREPTLRRRAGFGALGFAAFTVLWTTIAFLLSGAPYHYGNAVIGLFGLVGAAGAVCANVAGRFADRARTKLVTGVCCFSILLSFLPIYWGHRSLPALIVGIVLLDLGVQGLQVTNQSIIYELAPNARSRITSAYMVCYFAGGAVGSAIAGSVYGSGGWRGVCILGAGIGVVATVGFVLDVVRPVGHARRSDRSIGPEGVTA